MRNILQIKIVEVRNSDIGMPGEVLRDIYELNDERKKRGGFYAHHQSVIDRALKKGYRVEITALSIPLLPKTP